MDGHGPGDGVSAVNRRNGTGNADARSIGFDEDGALAVERAVVELQRGREVRIGVKGGSVVVASLETADAATLDALADAVGSRRIVVSAERADALGVPSAADSAVELTLAGATAGTLRAIAGLTAGGASPAPEPAATGADSTLADAAVALARHAMLLPALAIADGDRVAADRRRLAVEARDILRYGTRRGATLVRVSTAPVPLAAHEDCEFVVYRERFGVAEHVAIVVGQPDRDAAVPIRLHSSCLTGDLFGSLRCDCGEQLVQAVERLAGLGGGVLLYVAQEGRGIGLANKLRAYRLQDEGLDTIDANRHLGFGADQRDYTVAHTMLADLGIRRVRLLTNNPAKIAALETGGVEVVERLPLVIDANPHNARYIDTKRRRAGHLGES